MPEAMTGDIAAHFLTEAVDDAVSVATHDAGKAELAREGRSLLDAYQRLGALLETLGLRQTA